MINDHFLQNQKDSVILVVDDQPKNLQVVGSILAPKGYKLGFAQNGVQALESVKQFPPDLILLDVMMPDMDGFEVCRRLKQDPDTDEIPVIFLTAKIETEDILQAFSLGAVDYVTKPFQSEELLARVQNHLDLRNAVRKLAQLNEQKTELLAIAAHDLKNPISAIRGLAEVLVDSFEEPENFQLDRDTQIELMKDIYLSSDNTLLIINQVLNTESIASGKATLSLENFPIDELVRQVVQLNTPHATKKEIEIEYKKEIDNVLMQMDVSRMREIIDNLVSNAVKYSPLKKKVVVHLFMEGEIVRIDIIDQGPGLTDGDKEKVFGKFQKLSARPTYGETSTGLGLSIVKQLVEVMKGEVWVNSAAGEGATFSLKFPLN